MNFFVANLLLLSFLTLSVNNFAQKTDSPVDYMNAISNAQVEMNQKYMAYSSAVAHGRRAKKVEKMRQQTLESITNARYKTIALPIYKGDNSLRQAGIDYIQFCYNVFSEDYGKIVNMEEIAEQSFDQMQAYILLQEKTGEKLKEASAKMSAAEKAFATKYNINLIEGKKDELGEKMEIAGKLTHYTNQVYLVFFKCNWEYNQIIEALNKKKLNDVEQARNAVIKYAQEGMGALNDSLRSFQNDPALAVACKQSIQYYKKAAETDIPKLLDHCLKQENFDKLKKTMEAKSNKTQDDINAYNKAVKEINTSVQVFNQTNANLNNGSNQVGQNWQNAEKSFADIHMPYYRG
jgi:exonuclease VII small subunit